MAAIHKGVTKSYFSAAMICALLIKSAIPIIPITADSLIKFITSLIRDGKILLKA